MNKKPYVTLTQPFSEEQTPGISISTQGTCANKNKVLLTY